jgi:ABC-type Fe3+-hydroxamate transport system substrate-binding protein
MKKLLTLAFTLLLLGACARQSSENTELSNNARPGAGAATNTAAPDKPQAGDTVVYQSNTGQRFYEAKLLSIEGTRAKLQTETETIESDMADVYPIPKAGNRVTARAGDIVAARFGQTKVWPGAEVVKVGERVTIKWLSTGKSDEVAPENVLMISTAAAARVKASFPSSGK